MKEYLTLSALQNSTQTETDLLLTCRENLYSYIVQPSGYVATGDDVTFSNGRVGKAVEVADAKYIKTTGGNVQDDLNSIIAGNLPTQTGNQGKFLTTDGASASWQAGTIEATSFSELEALEPENDGLAFICQERANARYILQTLGYVAQEGDVTFANGRVGELQIRECSDLACFGVNYGEEQNQASIVQVAIDRIRTQLDGGVIKVTGTVWVSETIYVWERVWLIGSNGMVINWYQSDGTYNAVGAGFRLLPASNVDLIKLAISGNEPPGASIPSESNEARRHGGGLANMYLDGYRSEANELTAVDINSAGSPLVCRGVNVVVLHDLVVSRGAENNVVFESNGLADGQCNNMYVHRIYSQGSAQSGFNLSGGDSNIGFLWGSQNGINGLTSSMGNTTYTACTFNDNSENGLFSSGEDSGFVGVKTYDNRKNGKIIAGKNNSVTGGMSRHNGMNSSFVSTDRCGLVATSAASNCVIVGHKSFDDGYRGDALDITQQYGYRILNASTTVTFEANSAFGNVINDYSFQSSPIKRCYDGVVSEANAYTHSAPLTLSTITSNVLPASKGLITLNVAGGATINSITSTADGLSKVHIRNINSSSVTFTQSTSLASKSGSGITLGQYQGVTFQEFSDGVWYEV